MLSNTITENICDAAIGIGVFHGLQGDQRAVLLAVVHSGDEVISPF
jgi:hypothetical protein